MLSADLTPLMVEYADKTVDDILEVGVVGVCGGGGQRGWRGAKDAGSRRKLCLLLSALSKAGTSPST